MKQISSIPHQHSTLNSYLVITVTSSVRPKISTPKKKTSLCNSRKKSFSLQRPTRNSSIKRTKHLVHTLFTFSTRKTCGNGILLKNSYTYILICIIYLYFIILSFPIHTKSTVAQASIIRISSRPMFVIVSCGCCFFQSCIAFAILLPVLYSRKCSVTFLKMQFCTATSTAMAIFTLGLLKLLPQVSTLLT